MDIESYKEGKAIYDAQLDTVREESEERGEKRGVKKGREEGREEGIEEVAVNLLKLGIPLDQIAAATGLTKEELQKLTQK